MSLATFVQIHKMLVANSQTTLNWVTVDSVMIHIFSILMATFIVLLLEIFPKATSSSGCEAYPKPGNKAQLIFYWVFFMPLKALIPTLSNTLLCFHIWWKQLIPRQNAKYKALLLYFARLMSMIYLVIVIVVVSFFFSKWVRAIAFTIFNLVGSIQVCLALIKKDVRNAFIETRCCQKYDKTSGSTSWLQIIMRRRNSNANDASHISIMEKRNIGSGEDLGNKAAVKTASNEADEAVDRRDQINASLDPAL